MSKEQEYVTVGGEKYAIIKTGRAQAEQVLLLTKWVSKHGLPALEGVSDDIDADNGLLFITELVEHLTADALIDLFVVLVGCSEEDAEIYFDISILVDVAFEVYNRQPALRRIIERFFSAPSSEETEEDESSTTSE